MFLELTLAFLPSNQVAQLPLSVSDGRWHHICITWTTRDGFWEAYQDGERLGTGDNLAPWHPIKPGGVIILGQEQVRAAVEGAGGLSSVRVPFTHLGLGAGGAGAKGHQVARLFSRYFPEPSAPLRSRSYASHVETHKGDGTLGLAEP